MLLWIETKWVWEQVGEELDKYGSQIMQSSLIFILQVRQ